MEEILLILWILWFLSSLTTPLPDLSHCSLQCKIAGPMPEMPCPMPMPSMPNSRTMHETWTALVGNLVLLNRNRLKKTSKLEPLWSGPYKVLDKTWNVTYLLEHRYHKRFEPVVFFGLLKPYLTSSNPQKDEDDEKTPRLLPPVPPDLLNPSSSLVDLSDEPDYPPELFHFQEPDALLETKATRGEALYLAVLEKRHFTLKSLNVLIRSFNLTHVFRVLWSTGSRKSVFALVIQATVYPKKPVPVSARINSGFSNWDTTSNCKWKSVWAVAILLTRT